MFLESSPKLKAVGENICLHDCGRYIDGITAVCAYIQVYMHTDAHKYKAMLTRIFHRNLLFNACEFRAWLGQFIRVD